MTKIEFSLTEEGNRIPKVAIIADVECTFGDGKWLVTGDGFTGQGQTKMGAYLDWLSHRLGVQV